MVTLPAAARRSRLIVPCLTLAVALGASACEEEKKDVRAADAGASEAGAKGPQLDPELAAAVAAAASASAKPGAGAGGPGAPPDSGVFSPGKADVLHPKAAPSKIELLSEGTEPRVLLVPKAEGEQKTTVSVALRTGQQALPTILFGVAAKVDKPKAAGDKPADKPAEKPKDDADGPARVVCKVTSSGLAPVQPGALPKELADEVAKLKGSVIRYKLSKTDGAVSDYSVELPKGADPALDTALRALVDVLATVAVPAPAKPVGAGAYWMVEDRGTSAGIDVIRYRVFRVQKVDKTVSLSIDVRQYAASDKIDLAAAPKNLDLSLDGFESQGKGAAELTPGALLPGTAELSEKMQLRIKAAGQGDKRTVVPIELNAKVAPP